MRPSYADSRRDIDLQRYYQPWRDAQNLVNQADGSKRAKGLTYEGFQPRISHDKALTAFAQLATLRLGVRRAMVSLIDSNKQYILAEATRSLSLKTNSAQGGDEVWLGNSVIASADAVCPYTFSSTYQAEEDNGEKYVANALVISDCREDSRFCYRDYVIAEPGVRFYAGVPITTKNGHRIGVYAVSDEKPRDSLSAVDVRFLEDVAATIMEHLELAKDSDARNTGQRMVNGLTDFIQRSCLKDSQSSVGHRPTTLEKQTENARLEAIADEEPPSALPVAKQSQRKRESEPDTSRIYQRAARIIRQSTYAEGVVFFDVSAAHLGKAFENPAFSASSDENSYSSATAGSATANHRKRSVRRNKQGRGIPEDSEGNEDALPVAESKPCPVAGLSYRSSLAPVPEDNLVFTEASVERYITRYPHGKFFNFDAEGAGINSSDEKSESAPEHSDKGGQPGTNTTSTKRHKKHHDRFIPTELIKMLPNVRSLIFLPLFDPASEKWVAVGFVWTTTTVGRILNPDNELPYLKAFGNCITSEIARWNAQKADRAKTTFIASISHELRSPLHGILGSVEFLRDAVSSSYQQSLVHSIETCGRTLLDTIDHVLDYAKINKLRSANGNRKQHGKGRGRRVPADNSILGVTTVFDLAQLVEEVCDTVCAGHTFRKTHDIHNVAFHDQGSHSRAQSTAGKESITHQETVKTEGHVVVTLNVAPFMKWIVRSQPGALRRVVMNILGNALKYTETGFITISLEQNQANSDNQSVEFAISVQDSGRGMSKEYQRTKLFAPFSQEDPFSNGTGLGLSIVKQIVESLKGEVDVQSTLGEGTTVSVVLRLPRVSLEPPETAPAFRNKIASVVFPSTSMGGSGEIMRDSIMHSCHGLYIKGVPEFEPTKTHPEFLITEPDSLIKILEQQQSNGPNLQPLTVICVCIDPTEKITTETKTKQFTSLPWTIHIIAQPCGPRRLIHLLTDEYAVPQLRQLPHRPVEVSPLSAPLPTDPTDTKLPILRSISEFTLGGSSAMPQSIQGAHSPLISASMPNSSISSSSTVTDQIVDTPLSEAPSEYFTPRVLLVDDNAINLKLLVVFAQRQSLRYAEATNGLEALNLYKKDALSTDPPSRPFDFILMDLSMPVMGGLESTRSIRQFEAEKNLTKSNIVALTGLASAQDQQDAYDAGVDEYLVKPVKFADIKRIFGTK
ncbi:hypothetical protein DM02DRAFT_567529 [Periconia macrospinosa]|uniref:histidine kinase n=1 Tax=Periconia macrospinosa TaxID=97972 RepID=A0A2V1DHP0_9PLEO|nr:hypothetical protein DM02DRAFT_567529 [Periconia macrospinosa]